jgi:trans-aconitate methyltransferase
MWQKFLPNTQLYGLDINPAIHLENDQVKTYVVDQSSTDSLEDFKSQTSDVMFDVIIDDGSHIADHQQLTLSVLWSKLKPGGYYFIEDLNDQRPGNSKHQKHAPISCESTREVFKEYLKDGTVNAQNNFTDTTFFEEASYIALHSFPCVQRPKDFIKETIRYLVGRGGKGLLRHEYRTYAPKMIVLRKAES